jgi:hypothetical protein
MKKLIALGLVILTVGALVYYLTLSKLPLPVPQPEVLRPESVETVTIDSFEDCPEPVTAPCDPADEMCERELTVLKSHCSWIQRPDEDRLIVNLRNGETKIYKNRASEDPEEPEEFVVYHAEHYQKTTDYLVIFAAQIEFYHRIVLNLQTGQETSVAGEVTWSPDGRFFVSTNEDWAAAFTPNEVKVFYCGKPDAPCRQVYSRDDVGGRDAVWHGPDRVSIQVTTEEIIDQETLERREIQLNCECTEEACACR